MTDEELMRAYVAGDAAAFRELFTRYAPVLTRLTSRHLNNEELAREVVQQTFFQLHAARHDFREGAKLRPWVFTIAMNLVREHYRRRSRRRETPIEEREVPAARDSQPPPSERQARIERIRAALSQLPASQREVVELHWLEERPFAEVARIVGASEGAVRVRAHRAYQRLKGLLASEERE